MSRSSFHVLGVLALVACACRREPASTPEAAPVPAPAIEAEAEVVATPPTTLVVRHAEDLASIDLHAVEALDLALSPSDLVGFIDAHDPAAACEGLDLAEMARRTPALRTLRISGCPAAVQAGLAAFGSRLRTLELADLVLDGPTIDALAAQSGLVALTLTRITATPAPLRPLTALPLERLTLNELERDSVLSLMLDQWPRSLVHVTLSGSWAGHNAMLTLAKATALRSLELVDTRVGNYSLNQVKPLAQLEHVALRGPTFNDNSPLYFRDLPVVTFVCDCPGFGDAGLRSLRHSEGIRVLELRQGHVTGSGLEALAPLHDLEAVAIDGCDLSGPGFEALARHKGLRRLELGGALTDPEMEGLGLLTELRVLRLRYENLGDRVAPELARLVALEELDLGGTRLSDAGLSALAGMTELRVLRLHHTRITHGGLVHLARLGKLEVLELDHTDVVDGGVTHLAGLVQLRELRLDDTLVTDAAVQHLLGLQALEKLNLANTVVTRAGAEQLAELPALRLLGLEGSRVEE